jgi:NifU-like protein involved in Fe-S cluster formation
MTIEGGPYPAPVLQRLARGERVGALPAEAADVGTGVARAARHGDVVRIQVRIDAEGVIREARFKAFGCGWAIASASLAAQLIEGRPASEARALTAEAIVAALRLPAAKRHYGGLAVEAVGAALADHAGKTGIGATLVTGR